MMSYEIFFIIYLYFILWLVFIIYKSSFLIILIVMEYMVMMNLYMLMIIFDGYLNNYMLLYYLIFGVIESVLGLSLMVIMIRCYGSEMMMFMNMSLW